MANMDIEAIMTLLALATGIPLTIWADREAHKPRPYDQVRDRWYDNNEVR